MQAGFENGTDSEWVKKCFIEWRFNGAPGKISIGTGCIPHIAAEKENINITVDAIKEAMPRVDNLVIEGAGGLMVPLNKK